MFRNKTWEDMLNKEENVLWTPDTSREKYRAEERQKEKLRKKINSQLKPCPFCGGRARIEEREKYDGCSYEVLFVQCAECHARTEEKICDGYYGQYCSDEEVAGLWNRRWILK